MTTVDPVRWTRLSELFDALADAAPDERERRLQALHEQDPAFAAELAAMLAGDAADGPLDHTLVQPSDPTPADQGPDRSGQRIGAYCLLRPIGRGGMGEVWLAERAEADFQQRVAIKLLKRGMDSDALLRRFARERRILAQLEHPNIARLLDGGVAADGTPFIAMEFIDGLTITEYARRHGLGPRRRAELLLQAADAVAHAQARLVVHRDIKPSNILVDGAGRVHVLDFGIAKLLDDTAEEALTATGVGILSPAYAAPEQIRGEPVTTATDVYALGGVLFELLTGRLPHPGRGGSPGSWLRALDTEVAERPSACLRQGRAADVSTSYGDTPRERLLRELHGDLDTIVVKTLQPEPARRYATAAELAADLRRYFDGRPIAAQPDTAGYRLRRFVARHRVGVGSASAVLLALIAGFGIALWQADVARDQARRADAQAQRAQLAKEFVLSLYSEQDPVARAQAQARSPRELVAAGIERARVQLADVPDLQAEVLADLAGVQVALGDAAVAHPVLAAHHARRVAARGAAAPDSAIAAIDLAAAELALGRYDAALPLLEQALAALPEVGSQALQRARAQRHLAQALQHTEGSAAALPAIEAAHATLVALRGADDPETISALANRGVVLEGADRIDDAAATFREVIERLERSVGPEHARLVIPLATLSDVLRRKRDYAAARPLLERSIAIARAQLPDPHPMVGAALMRQGDLLRRMGELDAASASLDAAAAQFAPNAPQQGQISLFRGGVARARGDTGSAVAAFERAHAQFLAGLGPDSLYPWMAAVQHGTELVRLGRLEEAEAVLAEALPRLEAVTGPESLDTGDALTAKAQLRAAQGQVDQAIAHYTRALDIRRGIYGEDDPGVAELRQHIDALR